MLGLLIGYRDRRPVLTSHSRIQRSHLTGLRTNFDKAKTSLP